MKLAVLAGENEREELLRHGWDEHVQVLQSGSAEELAGQDGADAYIDLLFEPTAVRMDLLKRIGPKPVIISSVIKLSAMPTHFVRINGWPGFLGRNVVEACCEDAQVRTQAELVFAGLRRAVTWTPDVTGFITARVVAMIINEAFFALGEKVSTREEIDTAMKLGTNYPYGPFEWAAMIGQEKIVKLLNELAGENKSYEPAELLLKGIPQ